MRTYIQTGLQAKSYLFSALENDILIDSYATYISAIGSNRRVVTFSNKDYNLNLSKVQQYQFTFFMESSGSNLLTDGIRKLTGN